MGHSQLETTRSYLDEIGIDDLAEALARAAAARQAQASADQETERVEAPEGPEDEQWRRRESNPRKVPSGPEARQPGRRRALRAIASAALTRCSRV